MTKYNGEKSVEQASMFDVNKTIMRCLVKNIAMFGLGLYIYAGEDLPEEPPQPQLSDAELIEKYLKQNPEINLMLMNFENKVGNTKLLK